MFFPTDSTLDESKVKELLDLFIADGSEENKDGEKHVVKSITKYKLTNLKDIKVSYPQNQYFTTGYI